MNPKTYGGENDAHHVDVQRFTVDFICFIRSPCMCVCVFPWSYPESNGVLAMPLEVNIYNIHSFIPHHKKVYKNSTDFLAFVCVYSSQCQ